MFSSASDSYDAIGSPIGALHIETSQRLTASNAELRLDDFRIYLE